MATDKHFNYTQKIHVKPEYDLIVAGGGPAGTAAAVAAAKEGISVLLVEANGSLGGMATTGLVSSWYCLGNNEFSISGGLLVEWCEELYRRGAIDPAAGPPEQWFKTRRGFGFDPEVLKVMLDEYCRDAGVEVIFSSRVIDVDQSDNTIHGVIINNVEGTAYYPTKSVIDATGDAVVCKAAGVKVLEAGRDTENIMPPTLCARIDGIDYSRFDRLRDQQGMVDKAVADGFFSQTDRHVPGLFRTGDSDAIMNAGHIFDMDALSIESLSQGYVEGRKFAMEYVDFYRKYLDGCENIKLEATAPLMGVRESRRIVGEYFLDWDDYDSRKKFPDQIAVYCKQVDVHVYAPTDEEYNRVYNYFDKVGRPAEGEYYGIPYGVLVPRGWHNLWAAGRCVSTDIRVNGSLRDQPGCIMMGQAAGTAAAQVVRTGQRANDLDTQTLIKTLRDRKAFLPQEKLSSSMTRNDKQTDEANWAGI